MLTNSIIVIIVGVGFLIFGIYNGYGLQTNLEFIIGIIVAGTPIGYLLTLTICLAITVKRMA